MSGRDKAFPRAAAADARAFCLQRTFRALLDATARPGELAALGEAEPAARACADRAGLLPQTVSVLDVVLDAGTTFCVAGQDGDKAASELALRTHALVRDTLEAAFCVIPLEVAGSEAARAVLASREGTLESPHLGATCVVECATLLGTDRSGERAGSVSGAGERSGWVLSGPGIKGTARLECDRADVMEARLERADEFPCGVDLVFVDGAGHVACVPRSTRPVRDDAADGGEVRSWAM